MWVGNYEGRGMPRGMIISPDSKILQDDFFASFIIFHDGKKSSLLVKGIVNNFGLYLWSAFCYKALFRGDKIDKMRQKMK